MRLELEARCQELRHEANDALDTAGASPMHIHVMIRYTTDCLAHGQLAVAAPADAAGTN
jgi:hypothetical protein